MAIPNRPLELVVLAILLFPVMLFIPLLFGGGLGFALAMVDVLVIIYLLSWSAFYIRALMKEGRNLRWILFLLIIIMIFLFSHFSVSAFIQSHRV